MLVVVVALSFEDLKRVLLLYLLTKLNQSREIVIDQDPVDLVMVCRKANSVKPSISYLVVLKIL